MVTFSKEEYSLFALTQYPFIEPSKVVALVDFFGSAEQVLNQNATQLRALNLLAPKFIPEILKMKDNPELKKQFSSILAQGIGIIDYRSNEYPKRLLNIASFPPMLFYKGDVSLVHSSSLLGIVGTRQMTEYGKAVLQNFIPILVKHQVTIVSGLAFGIDYTAHEECVAAKGKTIAVLAQGVDKSYPRGNQKLYDTLVNEGHLVISEFPMPHEKLNDRILFPRRNRIVSGLCDGVLVVEAPKRSGALITTGYALDQNRDVFSVPGNIDQEMSQGCLQIIKHGAIPVTKAEEIISELGIQLSESKQVKSAIKTQERVGAVFTSRLEEKIFTFCRTQAKALDDIIEHVSEPASFISATVTKMQLMGYLQEESGRRFVAVRNEN
ncbi:MAG: DNA-processing protein DprA [bacterium]|nr:DNA-processing protein DprA [bacterium]MBU1918181.1 DNA-processing protein DprA [bacterium]